MTEPVAFSNTTPRLSFPLLSAGQSQKEFIVNETLVRLDALVAPVIQEETPNPPGAPVTGDAYLVADAAVGDWSGQDGNIALANEPGWTFVSPMDGLRVFDAHQQEMMFFLSGWRRPDPIPPLSGGDVMDVEARDTLTSLAGSLRNLGIIQ